MIYKELWRLLRFGVTGCLNTAVDWLLFFLLASLAGVAPALAQALGYLAGVTNSWFLNSLWVFRSGTRVRAPRPAFARFLMVTGLSTAATAVAMHFLARFAAMPLLASKLLVTGLGMTLNYLLYRSWVFGVDKQKQET